MVSQTQAASFYFAPQGKTVFVTEFRVAHFGVGLECEISRVKAGAALIHLVKLLLASAACSLCHASRSKLFCCTRLLLASFDASKSFAERKKV
jgi:hypothetical protein